MRRGHFEALRPLCPVCWHDRQVAAPLQLASVAREEADIILEGILHCPDPACQREYPIIDGLPLLVPNLRTYVSEQLSHLLARDDLSADLESLIGDCCGPGSAHEQNRQYLSCYASDHYDDLDPERSDVEASGVVGLMRELMPYLRDSSGTPSPPTLPQGERGEPLPPSPLGGEGLGVRGTGQDGLPLLDAGCSTGRGTFALAEHADSLVLGIDLNVAMLRVAAGVLYRGKAHYQRKRVGLAYDRCEFAVSLPGRERVDFWVCDVMAPPFAPDTFGGVVALNVLDCVASPLLFLQRMAALIAPGGSLALTTPYDWSSAVPVDAWLGGHSQRGPHAGRSEPILRGLLTPGIYPQSLTDFHIVADLEHRPWRVRMHDRSVIEYQVHALVAQRDER